MAGLPQMRETARGTLPKYRRALIRGVRLRFRETTTSVTLGAWTQSLLNTLITIK
jgi:aryl carrier-like protein